MSRGTVTMHLSGVAELERKLEALNAATASADLQEAALAGAAPILEAILESAPVRTGELRASILAEVVASDRDHVTVEIGAFGDPAAHLVEFGHQQVAGGVLDKGGHVVGHVPAHPFARPAFDREKTPAVDALAKRLREQLTAAAR